MQIQRNGRKIQMRFSSKTERTITEKNGWDETDMHVHMLLVNQKRER